MDVCFLVAIVTRFDHRVKDVGKDLVRLFISSYHSNGHDEGVTWVVYPRLDGSIEGEAIWCLERGELSIDFFAEVFCHVIAVLRKVREIVQHVKFMLRSGGFCTRTIDIKKQVFLHGSRTIPVVQILRDSTTLSSLPRFCSTTSTLYNQLT